MKFTSFEHYLEQKNQIDAIVDNLHNKLNDRVKFPIGEMGLPTNETARNEEYKFLTLEFKKNFSTLRTINEAGVKQFKKQIYEMHMLKRKQKMQLATI